MERTGSSDIRKAEFFTRVGAESVSCHQLRCNLPGELRGNTPRNVDLRKLGMFKVGLGFELAPLSFEVSSLGVCLRAY